MGVPVTKETREAERQAMKGWKAPPWLSEEERWARHIALVRRGGGEEMARESNEYARQEGFKPWIL